MSVLLPDYPLSHGQAALWFLHRLAPESTAYNLAGAVAIPGDTDLQALRRAAHRLAQRHPMLRATFTEVAGEPVQRVHPDPRMAFQCEDASSWSSAQLEARLASEIYRPFDLEQSPLWRVYIFQNALLAGESPDSGNGSQHLVLLVLHHIVGDLWSIAIMMSEIAAFYREETTGAPSALKRLRASYADYVYQQAEMLAGPRAQSGWDYWREFLAGELTPLGLPTDRPRPAMRTGRGAVHSVRLDGELSDRLRALAQKYHVALYTVLLAAFQTLLHRYTGQDDICVGCPKAGRSPAMARVIGYFINAIVIRADFAGNPRYSDLLQTIQKAFEASSQHDWFPFPLLVQRLRPNRDLSGSPLIQVTFSWQQTTRLLPRGAAGSLALGLAERPMDLGGLRMTPVPLPHRAAPFDLSLLAAEVPGGLAAAIEYDTELFDASTIARMAQCYVALLESIADAPEEQVSALTILSDDEQRVLLHEWDHLGANTFSEACLPELIEQQVERTPDTLAVVAEDQQLTYRQLNQQANQLAHALQQRGAGPETLVGLCLQPSPLAVVALLAVLKAGGTYLPLDPAYPPQRLAFMLRDAAAPLLLTHSALRPRLPAFAGTTLCLDTDAPLIRQQPDTNPTGSRSPDQLAYVIYTSGSTGQPKGVALAHRGVVSLLADFHQRQPLAPGDACSWWTSLSFDVSVYEIFSALLAGATLHVVPPAVRLDAPALLDWLEARHIRSAYLPPFLLADFAARLQTSPTGSALRRLLVGVEPIPEHLLTTICARLPDLCLLNGYGPTETTICSTLYVVAPNPPAHPNTPIGRPVANTQIYLLDRQLQPVPVSAPGEVYIGGVGLARGYLHRPELTAERFVPNPFGAQPGTRLYRTGDRARYLPDGNLEFLGRVDTQVKLRGVRIELGEIEAALAQHPAVKHAVVLDRQDRPGQHRLVAYWVPTANSSSPTELRHFLAQRLPDYMLPSAFVERDALPLTPSGKVDRQALPAPDQRQPDGAFLAPRTEVERILVSIWQQVLGVAPIGVDDNFFDLGGDSIMSLQIAARAKEAGLHLSPRHVFQAPTVAGLAALAEAGTKRRTETPQGAVEGQLPLTPIQSWFFERDFPEPHHWNQSLMFVTPQALDPANLRSAVAALLAHHDALRLRFTQGPLGWQQTCGRLADEIPCEVVDLSAWPDPEQAAALQSQAASVQRSLNLSCGPLIRVVYFVLRAGQPGRLLIVIHHLVVDGVSWRILLEDLQTAYRQLRWGEPVQLPRKTTAFGNWAQRLVDFAQSPELRQEASFWLSLAETRPPRLPVDLLSPDHSPDGSDLEAAAHSVSFALSRRETQALLRDVPTAYETQVIDVLLTALVRAFQRWTGSASLWIDLEGHGREDLFDDVDLTRTVGWFTASYPLRLELPLDAGPAADIKAIQEQLEQVPRHGLGYGLLRHLCRDQELSRRIDSIPPRQVSFNYLGQFPQAAGDSLVAALAPESVGPQRCPSARRPYLLDISASVVQGELRIEWKYNSEVHRRGTIEGLASSFADELRALVAHCRPLEVIGYIPPEFRDAGLSQTELRTPITDSSAPSPINTQRNIEAVYPLAPMQQGMLFHSLHTPESGIYLEQMTCTIQGPLDLSAFARASQCVLDRHTILRTSFVWKGLDRMWQIVHKNVELPLELQDWSNFSATEQQVRFDALLTSERRRGFDLSRPPLWRMGFIRTAGDTHRLLFSCHHALLDGWSIARLVKELFSAYDAFATHEELTLPPARPYRDFVAWLNRQDLGAAEAFWRKTLAGYRPAPSLPIQRAAPLAASTTQPVEQQIVLSAHLTAALQSLARQHRLTLSTIVQGAWGLLLSHYSQRDEVLFGVTVSGRPPDLLGDGILLGLCINTLPLRMRIDPQSRLTDWLHQLQDQAAEARQYDYSPLVQIHAWSEVPPGSSLFDTILVFENYPIEATLRQLHSRGLVIGDVQAIEQTHYPVALAVTPGQPLHIKISYDPARFEPVVIRGVLGHLRRLLETMAADLGQRVAAVPLWTGVERQPPVCDEASVDRERVLVAPRTRLEQYLTQIWQELLNIERIGVSDDFFELGGDSLLGAALVSRLRGAMREEIALAAIFEAPTILALASYLEANHAHGVAQLLGTSRPSPPETESAAATARLPTALVPIQPKGNRHPLYCIHPAGGIVFPYYTLAPYVGADQPVYGLQDPSLYDRRSAFTSIGAMAAHYVGVLQTIQPEGPYHLLGWSVGGIVAYEMAQQLSKQSQTVSLLVMLDTSAPAPAWRFGSKPSLGDWLQRIVSWPSALAGSLRALRSDVKPIASYVHSGLFLLAASARRKHAPSGQKPTTLDLLRWAAFDTWRTRLLQEADVAATVSQETRLLLVEMPAVRRVLQLVRQHRRLARHYSAETYPGQITLFRAFFSEQSESPNGDPTLGWGKLAEHGVEIHTLRANHVALLAKPYVETLARELRLCLIRHQDGY